MVLLKTRLIKILFLYLVFLAFGFAYGQIEEHVKVELVQIDVVATDSKGAFVTDLKKEDFSLKDSGNTQDITHFYNSANDQMRYPLTISFLVDTSYSMGEKVAGLTRIDVAIKAGDLIMNQLRPRDQIELVEFNDQPKTIVQFT